MDISHSEQIAQANAELNEIYAELETVDTYILVHEADQLLMKSFSMIRRDFDQMKLQKNILGQIMDYLNKAEAQEASAKNDLDELNFVGTDILKRKEQAEKTLAELEASGSATDSDIETAKNELEEVLAKAENLEIALKEANETLSKASAEVQQFSGQRDETTATYDRLIDECHDRLAPFGIENVSLETIDEIRLELTGRIKSWQDMNAKKQQLMRRKQDIEAQIQQLNGLS